MGDGEDEDGGVRDYGPGAPAIPVTPWALALPRMALVALVLAGAVLVGVPLVVSVWLLGLTLVVPALAEVLQHDGALEVAPFAVGFWFSQLSLAGLLLWVAWRAWRRRRTGRPRLPWLPFWIFLGLMLVLILLPRLLPEASAMAGLVFLGGALWVVPLAGLSLVVWGVGVVVRGAWRQHALYLRLVPALLVMDLAAGALWGGLLGLRHNYYLEDQLPSFEPKGGPVEGLRLVTGWFATLSVTPGVKEPAVPGVFYSATGPIRSRRAREATPAEVCFRTLVVEPDPSQPSTTPVEVCARMLRAFPESEGEASSLAGWVCAQATPPAQPVPYFVQACTNKRKTLKRAWGRWNQLDETGGDSDEQERPDPEAIAAQRQIARCLEGAMAALPEIQKVAVGLSLQGYQYPEISEQVGVTIENARQLVSRGRRRLQARCGGAD